MSGGNHIKRPLRASFLAALLLGIAGNVAASETQAGSEIGIATANIAWTAPDKVDAIFGEIAATGFNAVRIGLKNPVERTYAAMKDAKAAGLDILVTIPLIDGAVATKGAAPRAKQGRFFPAFGLSQIDPVRFKARLDALLDFAVAEEIPLLGIELGNEFNWSGYNGDLPLQLGGKVITSEKDLPQSFTDGLSLYSQALDLARASLAAHPQLQKVRLVTAGLADINENFIRKSNATYVAPDLVYAFFARANVFGRADGIGIHLYEPLRRANAGKGDAMVDRQLAGCGAPAFGGRPCWITEFGSALPAEFCATKEEPRLALLQPLLTHLGTAQDAVPYAFYYDWSEDKGFALERCGHLTDLARELARFNQAPVSP